MPTPSRIQVTRTLLEGDRPVLGILTCKRLRNEASVRPVLEEVCSLLGEQRFADFIQDFQLRIAMTGGTYEALRSRPSLASFPWHQTLALPGSALGVIQLANLVVHGVCPAILFFNDLEDLYADSVQNLTLRRIANTYNVPLLEDFESIHHVLTARWYEQGPPKSAASSADAIADYLKGEVFSTTELRANRAPRRETLAVIAHDGKKLELMIFCMRNMTKILGYHQVIATGTTGLRLRELFEAALGHAVFARDPAFRRAIGWPKGASARSYLAEKILPFKSGPDGGDVQISSKIIDGTCHRVVFFEDPKTAHPHVFDIRLMEKTAQDPDTGVLLATSEQTAEWILD